MQEEASCLDLFPLSTDLTTPRSTSGFYWCETASIGYLFRMLSEDIFPEIQAVLGPRRWGRAIFQQVCLLNLSPPVNWSERMGRPFILPTPPWTSLEQCLETGWCQGGEEGEWTGHPTRQTCPLQISGFMATWRLLFWVVLFQNFLSQDRIYHPMPQTLAELLQHAEHVVDDLNNNKQAMVVRSVLKMKAKAQACIAVGGGVFEGRRVWIVMSTHLLMFCKSWLEMSKWFWRLHYKT